MKRLVLLLLAAGGAALWWKNRSSNSADNWSASSAPETPQEPPKLGGDVDPELLSILACPLDKQPVTREAIISCARSVTATTRFATASRSC